MVWRCDRVWHRDRSRAFQPCPCPAPEQTLPHRARLPCTPVRAASYQPSAAESRRGGRGAEPPRWDSLLPSAGTAAGFPGRPSWPSAGRGAAGAAPTRQAVLGPAAARPAPPGAALFPGKKWQVTRTAAGLPHFCPAPPSLPEGSTAGAAVAPPARVLWLPVPPGRVATSMPVSVPRLRGRAFPSQQQGVCWRWPFSQQPLESCGGEGEVGGRREGTMAGSPGAGRWEPSSATAAACQGWGARWLRKSRWGGGCIFPAAAPG